ncbi:MAG: NFACT family protein [Desertifilum sp.]|nr:NFACT family protein [Desertifilum sp.]
MQPVDFTTLTAVYTDLQANWLPARLEQVYQRDRHTICLALRTFKQRGWLTISRHPQAAHLCIGDPPPKAPDTFTFSDQLRHQLNGLALVAITPVAPWERALDLQFAKRPGDAILWHLYVEIMGKYSNIILANADNQVVTVAQQVSEQKSSVRPLLTGQPYELPPALTQTPPSLSEPQPRWQERVSLIPGSLKRQLLKTYRGLSSQLVESAIREAIRSGIAAANLHPEQTTDTLTQADWDALYQRWQEWLTTLEKGTFQPGWTQNGYTVMGWGMVQPVESVQSLVYRYYRDRLNQQEFAQLRHKLRQKVDNLLGKLGQKAQTFRDRLNQSDQADTYRQQADLLMAHLHEWEAGMQSITLTDFETGEPVTIPLNPEKNAVSNAQSLYKRHQKLKRARNAVEPLLAEVSQELHYLEQVAESLSQLEDYYSTEDLQTLEEISEELSQQGYLETPEQRQQSNTDESHPHRYQSPSGFEVLVGRNNRQNDLLTFRLAGDYDLWFHTQEIPGSHVLLRLQPGSVADEPDLQFAANLAAQYSQGRQSEQVPVVYTEPKHVYKPKGAKPGMVIYKQERILWGKPENGRLINKL